MKAALTLLLSMMISINIPATLKKELKDCGGETQESLFSFGVIADIQYCDCDPAGTRFYRSSPEKLKEALDEFKNSSVDFVINLGDIIDRDFVSYQPIMNIMDSSGLRIYHITGNHDYSVTPRMKKRISGITGSDKGYYHFTYKNYRFIFLNGNEISTYMSNRRSDIRKAEEYIAHRKSLGEINAVDWNGGIGSDQLAWLSDRLTESVENSEKVFLICHFPVVPENIHNLLNYKEVLSLLDGYDNIIAWFNGHNHAGNYGNNNSIHFVTFKGMVETASVNSFAIVEVYNNRIWIRGYGREKNQILGY